MLYPVLWMIVCSLRPNDQIFSDPGSAQHPAVGQLLRRLDRAEHPFGHYMINSAIVVLGCVVGNLFSCSMAAYAFARLQFKGKSGFFAIMLLTIMLPIHVVIVPQYIMFSQLGWVEHLHPADPAETAGHRRVLRLPDGPVHPRHAPRNSTRPPGSTAAGHPQIFLEIILPLMVPALATTAIFTFIWTWNDFFSQLIYLTDPDHVHRAGGPEVLRGLPPRTPPGDRCSRCPSSPCCPSSWRSSSARGS